MQQLSLLSNSTERRSFYGVHTLAFVRVEKPDYHKEKWVAIFKIRSSTSLCLRDRTCSVRSKSHTFVARHPVTASDMSRSLPGPWTGSEPQSLF